MKTSMYLYGGENSHLISINNGADDRIAKAKILIKELLKEPLKSRDFKRIDDICKAIKHWENLKN
ncbi:hypothetical protein CPIN18021_0274 [Campylobacter pinnipediorum subsp. caledonicus]|uniref:Uncharacterized protein n=1 Tax=Campylobacter pinnipediorum subsp. caledonicus TaxID=1874362 RepID=A0A1S6U5V9_9BACT|nr:hypothetical protein [Campylobacter pinnipediorum]AQW87121.1 hypothetical protein CPIN18021_0274 [Campylobacter pinnipediorum subsp. caledonicus]